MSNTIRRILKLFSKILTSIFTIPSNYKYYLYLDNFLKLLSQRMSQKCIRLFSHNSKDQFESGSVYQYKTVVQYKGNSLQINKNLTKERMNDIFLNKEILNYLKISDAGTLLEVGCEAGQNLILIKKYFPHMQLYGCDISTMGLMNAEKSNIFTQQVNLLKLDALGIYQENQVDYILMSHVLEHLVTEDLEKSKKIMTNTVKHIHRIAKMGYVITTSLISSASDSLVLSMIGHSRVALQGFPIAAFEEVGVSNFLLKINPHDDSLSIVVKKTT